MLWNNDETYTEFLYGKESELENAVSEVKEILFGSSRIYVDEQKENR